MKKSHNLLVIIVAVVLLGCTFTISHFLKVRGISSSAATFTCDKYASPSVFTGGDGSQANPWPLQTALSQGSALSNKNLCLNDGTYYGKYESNLVGATVRSAPGAWAKVDGYSTTTLSAQFPTSATTLTLSNTYGGLFHEGMTVFIDEEVIYLASQTGNVFNIERRGGPSATHSSGATVIAGGSPFMLTSNGSGSTYRDFEVTNTDPFRTIPYADTQDGPHHRSAFGIHAANTKIVNMVIHNQNNGIFAWPEATNLEIYGTLLYNNGYIHNTPPEVAGHGLYAQNNSGYKKIEETFSFNNFVMAMQEESVSGNAINFQNIGVVVFNNTLLLGTQSGTTRGAVVRDSHFYVDPNKHTDSFANAGGLRLGYTAANEDVQVTNNYFSGGNSDFMVDVNNWTNVTFTGNTFAASNPSGHDSSMASLETPVGASVVWNSNRYYDQSHTENCPGGSLRAPFGYNNMQGACGGHLRFNNTNPVNAGFSEWKEKGFDTNVTDLGSAAPSDPNSFFYTQRVAPTTVFVRPNAYEQGRANIIIHNQPGTATVSVDLSPSGLSNSQTYEIRNVQNYFGTPVAIGTYDSSSPSVSLNLTSTPATTVEQAIGASQNVPSSCPKFCAFVVVPTTSGGGGGDTTAPVLSAGAPSGAQAAGTASVDMTLTTNETATCKYGTTAGVAYGSIANTFTTTNSTSHSKTLTGLTNGSSYTYYIRCQDGSGNANTSDYTISFSVASPATVATPTISPNGGTFNSTQSVTLSTTTSGAIIRYTTNGTNPTSSSGTVYSSPFNISSTTPVKAIAYKSGSTDSSVASATFTINTIPSPSGTISATNCTIVSGGSTCTSSVTWSTANLMLGASTAVTRDNPTNTTVSSNTSGTSVSNTVRYGTSNYFLYHNSVQLATAAITASCVVGTVWDNTMCAVATTPTVSAPTISPNGGTFSSTQSVTLSTTTSGANIRYTTDGSTPSSTLGTIYSLPFSVSSTTTIKAIAYKSGSADSAIASAVFTKSSSGGGGGGGGGHSTGGGGGGGGAAANTYAGCEGRTTGFSSTTGKTCVGNTATGTSIPGCEGRNTGFSSINGRSCVGNVTTTTYYNFGPITLRNGSTGEGVKELQRYLNAKLNLGLVIDGKLGPKTIAVIKVWQLNHGLVPDGLVGPKTKAMMNSGV